MNIELGKNIDTRELETKIQKFWDDNHFWDNDVNSDKKSFCIMMPPPNVTGNLHMGHALDNVLTDIVCRYKECVVLMFCGNREQIMPLLRPSC